MNYKKPLFIFFCIFSIVINVHSQTNDTTKILFIGNSFTAVNDLPQTFFQLATKAGKKVYVDNSSMGGYTLQMHLQDAATIQKIYNQKWDYIVLQEQSQIPSFIPERETMMYPYAVSIDSIIHDNSPCTRTLFFMTWAHKNGDQGLPAGSDTYEAMQQRLRSGYMTIADTLDAAVVPCGWAWREVRQNYPLLELYSSDNYHPSENGTYLTACTFFAAIFSQTAVGINYSGNLTLADAAALQTTASQIVLDSLGLWNIGLYNPNPVADFGYTQNGNQIQFMDSSMLATTYVWDFGDGAISNLQNPLHSYSSSGTYIVRLIVSNECKADTVIKSIQYIPAVIENTGKLSISVSPNPFNDKLTIVSHSEDPVLYFEIIQADGKIIYSKKSTVNEKYINFEPIQTTSFDKGIYFLKIQTIRKRFCIQLIKL